MCAQTGPDCVCLGPVRIDINLSGDSQPKRDRAWGPGWGGGGGGGGGYCNMDPALGK